MTQTYAVFTEEVDSCPDPMLVMRVEAESPQQAVKKAVDSPDSSANWVANGVPFLVMSNLDEPMETIHYRK